MAAWLATALVAAACGTSAAPSTGAATTAPAASASSGGTSAASACGPAGAPLTVGELYPMTGREPFVGQWFLHGAKAAVYDINGQGGVMGHPLKLVLTDTAGDMVDAVPAWRKLEADKPLLVLGPSSLTIMAVIKQFDAAHIVDFTEGGTTQIDHMQYPYVFRTSPSDSTMGKGMAYFAIHKGWKTAAMLFESTSNAQTLVAPIMNAYQRHGGKVVANVQLVPHQSSYRSEVEKAFASHPQVIFFQADPQTTSTLAKDIGQLVGWHTPVVGTDAGATTDVAKAFGFDVASKWLYGMAGAAPSGPAWTHYVNDYNAVWHSTKPVELSQNTYDAAVIASLAMTMAHSCDPQVWVNDIVKVANPPGTAVYDYAQGVAALKAGKKINYSGATGPDDFNQYHNVFGGWEVVQFNSTGTAKNGVFHIHAKDYENY